MFPFIPVLLKNWRVVVAGLAALAICAIISLAYRHYTSLIAENARLAAAVAQVETAYSVERATVAQQKDALERWKAAEREIERQTEELNKATLRAAEEKRKLNEAYSHDLTSSDLAARGDVARLLRLFGCATTPSGCRFDGDTAAQPDDPAATP